MVRRAPLADGVAGLFRPNNESIGFEAPIQTFVRKQLRLKAHTVTKLVEREDSTAIFIDRLGRRLLRCGV